MGMTNGPPQDGLGDVLMKLIQSQVQAQMIPQPLPSGPTQPPTTIPSLPSGPTQPITSIPTLPDVSAVQTLPSQSPEYNKTIIDRAKEVLTSPRGWFE